MKALQSSIIRAVIAVVVGILLVKYREDTMRWMTIAVGIMFLFSGLISIVLYYYEKREIGKSPYTFDENGNEIKRRGPIFPLIGVGSTLLGIILMVMPTDLIIGVTYVLGAMLIIGALSQGYNLFVARRYWDIPIVYWLLPLITLGVGILVVVKPMEAATLPLKIIGWALMFYGVVECINAIAFYQARKRYEQQQKAIVQNAPSSIDTEAIEEATIVE